MAESTVKETPYSTLIGIYKEKWVLEDQTKFLNNLGYKPYSIEGQDTRYRLLVGAFVTEQGAEAQQQNLESKGIQSQVVRR